jgi:acetate kinase
LSYDHIAGVLPDHLGSRAQSRVIVTQLGNGPSMRAMKDRKSVVTSMWFISH